MLNCGIILFRETLEIMLIISIVMAATVQLPKRNYYIILGVVAGMLSSLILALFMNKISSLAAGTGQELMNIIILSLSVLMILWTIFWMGSNVKILKNKLENPAIRLKNYNFSMIYISLIVASSIIREILEIMIYCYGVALSHNIMNLIIGGMIGSFLGIISGAMFYLGIIKINKFIFTITNWLLVFLAASISSTIPRFLSSAGLLSFSNKPFWDLSSLLNEENIIGNILHIIIGYNSKPSATELIFYLIVLIIGVLINFEANLKTIYPKHSSN